MSDLPLHIEVTAITEWEDIPMSQPDGSIEKERKIARTEKRVLRKDLIREARKHEGYCILFGEEDYVTITEPYEEIARRLCQNNQES